MKIALDPYMHRRQSLREITHLAAELGYSHIEMSPRSDFLPFFVHPRADSDRIRKLKGALRETGVFLASLLPLYRWSSPKRGGAAGGRALLEASYRDRR